MSPETLAPTLSLLVKLGSIAVHADEAASSSAHEFDRIAVQSLLSDPEVDAFLRDLRKASLLPVKRTPA